MEIYERIRLLRKEYLKLSQEKFGEILGVNRSNINNIEGNRLVKPEQKEPLYKLICKEFNVRYEWLMTGEGEMFDESQDEFFDKLSARYGLGGYARKILELYCSLEDEQKQLLESFIYEVSKTVLEDNISKARSGVNDAIATAKSPQLIGNVAKVFNESFPYIGVGNIPHYQQQSSAVDNTIGKYYRAARSNDNSEPEVKEDGDGTIDKMDKIPPTTNKDEL